jgi:hypothetical protein
VVGYLLLVLVILLGSLLLVVIVEIVVVQIVEIVIVVEIVVIEVVIVVEIVVVVVDLPVVGGVSVLGLGVSVLGRIVAAKFNIIVPRACPQLHGKAPPDEWSGRIIAKHLRWQFPQNPPVLS